MLGRYVGPCKLTTLLLHGIMSDTGIIPAVTDFSQCP